MQTHMDTTFKDNEDTHKHTSSGCLNAHGTRTNMLEQSYVQSYACAILAYVPVKTKEKPEVQQIAPSFHVRKSITTLSVKTKGM